MSQTRPEFNRLNVTGDEWRRIALASGGDRPYLGAMIRDLNIAPDRPVLIAGPTASGKSALALEIAQRQGGTIINADSMQVFENWRILTARPSPAAEAMAAHRLYGHVARGAAYSAGDWLRDVTPLLQGGPRPIIVGGTGLYFAALTEGLADIPPTPPEVRAEADALLAAGGIGALLDGVDPDTRARIDTRNPMRVQRAWEVQRATGRGLAAWQADTAAPILPLQACTALVIDAPRDWLCHRIATRFERMIAEGALDEARENLDTWNASQPSAKAIGAPDLIAHLRGEMPLDMATQSATIATRQFAKRQRTWFRARIRSWLWITPPEVRGF